MYGAHDEGSNDAPHNRKHLESLGYVNYGNRLGLIMSVEQHS